MSPVRLLRNAAFDPETTKVLGEAYDEACRLVGEEPPASVREEIAKRIIEAARRGERDRDALAANAVEGLRPIAETG